MAGERLCARQGRRGPCELGPGMGGQGWRVLAGLVLRFCREPRLCAAGGRESLKAGKRGPGERFAAVNDVRGCLERGLPGAGSLIQSPSTVGHPPRF